MLRHLVSNLYRIFIIKARVTKIIVELLGKKKISNKFRKKEI